MEPTPFPSHEKERLEDLRSYSILDTMDDQDFDNITDLAASICQTEISLITFVDRDRQWFKSKKGIKIKETHRDFSFCAHAILNPGEISVFGDLKHDPRFKDNPYVKAGPKFAFYAGVPLVTEENHALGTLCVMDYEQKNLSESQLEALKKLAGQVVKLLTLRKTKLALQESQKELEEQLGYQDSLFKAIPDILLVLDLKGNFLEIRSGRQEDLLFFPQQFLHKNIKEIVPPEISKKTLLFLNRMRSGESSAVMEYRMPTIGGIKDFEARFEKLGTDKAIILIRNITQAKLLEQELVKTKEILEEAGKMAKVGAWEVDFVENTHTWSEITREILELDKDEEPPVEDGLKLYDTGESLEKITSAFEEAVKTGKGYDLELLVRTLKGNLKWVRTIGKPIMENGYCVKIFGTFQDISDRKKYEQEILAHSEEFERLFKTMAQGVVYQDREGKIIKANASAERILGLSLEQLLGRSSLDPRWHTIKEDGSPVPGSEHPAMISLRTGQHIKNQILGVFSPETESYRWILVDAIPEFKDGESTPYRVFTSFTDITTVKETEKRLIENEANLSLVIECSRESIWSVDRDCNIVYANQMFKQLFLEFFNIHLDRGNNILANLPKDQFDFWDQNYQKVFRGQNIKLKFNFEKDGEKRYYDVSMTPIVVEGKIKGAAVFALDNTSTEKYLHAIEEQNTRLKEIAWIQSHVVRAPLARMMGLTNLIESEDLDKEELVSFLHAIHKSATELDEVVRNIVDKSSQMIKM